MASLVATIGNWAPPGVGEQAGVLEIRPSPPCSLRRGGEQGIEPFVSARKAPRVELEQRQRVLQLSQLQFRDIDLGAVELAGDLHPHHRADEAEDDELLEDSESLSESDPLLDSLSLSLELLELLLLLLLLDEEELEYFFFFCFRLSFFISFFICLYLGCGCVNFTALSSI